MWCAAVDRSGQKVQNAVDQLYMGGQEIKQEKGLHIAAVTDVAPVAVVAPFAVIATIAVNALVFTSGSCYQLWSGSVVT